MCVAENSGDYLVTYYLKDYLWAKPLNVNFIDYYTPHSRLSHLILLRVAIATIKHFGESCLAKSKTKCLVDFDFALNIIFIRY